MAQLELSIADARTLCEKIFERAGVPAADAALVTDNLITADILGVASHGLMRVKPYVERITKGLTNPTPHIVVEKAAEHMFKINADGALGQVAAMRALDLCAGQARKTGSAIAVVNHMNHIGMVSYYTKKAAAQGLLAFACTNASPTMAPFGGLDCLLGTNPFSVSFNAGRYDNFTLDVATSAVARGKIRMYQKEGKTLPLGWAIDPNGNDTTDPMEALKGSLLPMAAHKGYGLAMTVDALSGLLAGANLSCESESMFDANTPANTGCYMSVVDISRFLPPATFKERVEKWFDRIKKSKLRPGFSEVFIPGEIENRKAAESHGTFRLLDKTWDELCAMAD